MVATRKKAAPPAPTPAEPRSARDYFAAEHPDILTTRGALTRVAAEAGVSYSTLMHHLRYGNPLSPRSAKKLAAWSGGKISAAKTLEIAN